MNYKFIILPSFKFILIHFYNYILINFFRLRKKSAITCRWFNRNFRIREIANRIKRVNAKRILY